MSDEDLIEAICRDDIFRQSIESELGRLRRIFPDWKKRILIYEFETGNQKHSDLDQILDALKDLNYKETLAH
jgi:hypothetical protein